MELRILIDDCRKQFAGVSRDNLCNLQDGIQYHFPYLVRDGQLEHVENAVQANYTNFLTSFKEVETQEKQVQMAGENYEVVQKRYQNDLALLTDMLDAGNTKLSADMALVNARITLLYHYYKLRYVTHTL